MILVDAKVPKRGCRNCPMNYDIDYCKITHKCMGKEFVEETFPSWCPIKVIFMELKTVALMRTGGTHRTESEVLE